LGGRVLGAPVNTHGRQNPRCLSLLAIVLERSENL
jgi:hypothetical protein